MKKRCQSFLVISDEEFYKDKFVICTLNEWLDSLKQNVWYTIRNVNAALAEIT